MTWTELLLISLIVLVVWPIVFAAIGGWLERLRRGNRMDDE